MAALLWLLAGVWAPGCSDDTSTAGGDVEAQDSGAEVAADVLADAEAPDVSDGHDAVAADVVELPPLPPQPWPVTEAGAYSVGYRETWLTYQPDGVTGERRLRLVVWYPTRATSGLRVTYANLLRREEVLRNPPVAPGGPFPVLVFSHGSGGFAEQSYFFTEFFASHGWVVAAVDHTGNTLFNANDGIPPEMMHLRPQDVTQVLDFLEALPTSDPLFGTLGPERVVAGHSFGGYTSLAVAGAAYAVDAYLAGCAAGTWPALMCDALLGMEAMFRAGFLDTRVDLIIPQAPSALAFDGGAAIDVPVLLITGARDRITTNYADGDPLWRTLDGPRDLRVDFANGGHFTFSDACAVAPGLALDDGCGEDFVDLDEAHRAVNAYALAFARSVLWGDTTEAALLAGTQTVSADVTLSQK